MAAPATSTPEVKLGPRLKELRTGKGLSQGALADQVGIDVTYLSKLENGRQRASEKVLRSLAEALGVEAAHLLVMAGRVPAELQDTLQASLIGEAPQAIQGFGAPRYQTTFINRDSNLRQLRELLERAGRLITVMGPPGCGKTRLMAELAADRAATIGPLAWVDVKEDERVGNDSLLDMRGGVLVLNDAEQNLRGCASIAREKIAGGTTVVATSRHALGMYGEQLLRLEPLPVPDRHLRPASGDEVAADPGRLVTQESVRLFMERAALAAPGLRLDRTNAPAIFDVCRWLDGIPLAIELAAMRLRQLTVADLAASTRVLLPWLAGNTLDVPARHTSMAAATEWTFNRLDDAERTIAMRLSLIETYFSRDDAIAVAADDEHPPEMVFGTVMNLVDHSLLQWEENPDGHAVYRWLRPIRQYLQRRLASAQEDHKTGIDRHRKWIMREFEKLDRNLPRRQSEWIRMAELTPELVSTVHNLPAVERDDALNGIAHALTKSLQFGNVTDHVDHFVGRFSGTAPGLLRESGTLARLRGDLDAAYHDFKRSYDLAEAEGDEGALANAAMDLAENASARGKYEEADSYLDEAERLYESLKHGDGQIEVLNLRGKILMRKGRAADAERHLLEALRLAEQDEETRLIAYSRHSLGTCDYLLGRISSARSHLQESLRLRVSMGNQRGGVRVIEVLALVESAIHNHELALRLLGAARQYRLSSGVTGVTEWWQDRLDKAEQEARVSIGAPGRAEQLILEGGALTLTEAGRLAATAATAELKGQLGTPTVEPLGWRISVPAGDGRGPAGTLAAGLVDETRSELEVALRELAAQQESGGGPADAFRRLHSAELFALAAPVVARMTDMLCFAVDPAHYGGVVVPLFTSGRTLAAALERCPAWAERPVLEVKLEPFRKNLIKGEMVVINPWTESEYRVTPVEAGHTLPAEIPTSTDAPTELSRSIRAS